MNSTIRFATVALLAITGAFAPTSLCAQDVLLNEVRADANGRWVELHNRSSFAVNLSTWSLHLGTHTVNMPQEYWWPFPAGTVLQPGAFLRVHWFQQGTSNPATGELFTGTTPFNFLFGLGGEALSGTRGAFCLFRSQDGNAMSTPTTIEDWVSWGEHDFSRESYAIAAGRWTAGRHVAAIPVGSSIARNTAAIGNVVFQDQQWFTDATPTPLAANTAGASITSYGASCAVTGHHLLGVPVLRAPSLPLMGNAQFGLATDNTTGVFGEYVLFVWSGAAAPLGQASVLPPVPGGCAESIDTTLYIAAALVPASIITTFAPFSLANLPVSLVGTEAHAQAFVLDLMPFAWSPVQGVSNALRVTFGS